MNIIQIKHDKPLQALERSRFDQADTCVEFRGFRLKLETISGEWGTIPEKKWKEVPWADMTLRQRVVWLCGRIGVLGDVARALFGGPPFKELKEKLALLDAKPGIPPPAAPTVATVLKEELPNPVTRYLHEVYKKRAAQPPALVAVPPLPAVPAGIPMSEPGTRRWGRP